MTDSGDRLKASSAPTADRDHAFDIAFGQRIRTARVAAGMSQSAIARAAGVTFQQVQKYEQGKNRMSVGTLQAIADALGVHPGSFFLDEGRKLSSPHQEAGRAQRVAEHIGERGAPTPPHQQSHPHPPPRPAPPPHARPWPTRWPGRRRRRRPGLPRATATRRSATILRWRIDAIALSLDSPRHENRK